MAADPDKVGRYNYFIHPLIESRFVSCVPNSSLFENPALDLC